MAKHACNKEAELQEIKDNIAYIKKSITGNGEEGLLRAVSKNSEFRLQSMANLEMIKWLLGISAFSVVISIINFINNLLR